MPDIFDRLAAQRMGTASRKPDIFDRVAAMPRTDIGDDSDVSYDQDPLSPSPRRTTGLETGARFDPSPLYGAGAASFGDKPIGETSFPQAAKGAGKALAAQSLGLLREGLKAGPGGEAIWGLGDLLARRGGIPEPSTFPIAQAFDLQPKTEDEAVGAIMAEGGSLAVPADYGVSRLARFLKAKRAGVAADIAKEWPPTGGAGPPTLPAIVPRGTSGGGPIPHTPGVTKDVTPPRFAYRVRDTGEQGVPSAGHAQASMSEADVRRMAPSRTDAPQEVVKVDLDRLMPDDFTIYPRKGESPWVKFNRGMAESDVERVGAITDADVLAAQKAAPALRQAVADAGSLPGEIAAKAGLSERQAAKGVEDVRRDAMHEFSPEAVQVKRAVLESGGGRGASAPAGQGELLSGAPSAGERLAAQASGPIRGQEANLVDMPLFGDQSRQPNLFIDNMGKPRQTPRGQSRQPILDDIGRPGLPPPVAQAERGPFSWPMSKKAGRGPLSVSEWVRSRGGLRPSSDVRSDWLGSAGLKEARTTGIVNRNARMAADEMAEEAVRSGYIPDGSGERGLLDAIGRDIRARHEGVTADRVFGWDASEDALTESMVANQRGSVTLPALPVRPKPGEGVEINVPSPSNRRLLEKALDILPGLRSPGERLKSARGKEVFEAIQELDQHTLPKWNKFTDKWIDDAFAPLRPSGIKRFLSAEARQEYANAKEKIRAALEGEIPVESLSAKERGAYRKLDQFRNKYAKAFGLEGGRFFSSYFPHVFTGRYQVKLIAPDGGAKTIPGGFADTLRAGTAMGEEFMAAHPDLLGKGYKTVIEDAKRAGGEGIAGFSHLLKREANLAGYAKDPEKIWRQYGHGGNRKLLADKMMKQIYPAYQRLPPEEREIADGLLKYVFGETPKVDRVVDGLIRDMGYDIAPHLASKVAENVRTFYFVTKLGLYNAGSAALNHTQVLTFGLAKLGPKYLKEGYKQYLFGGDKANTLLRRSGVLLEETRAGSQIEDLTGVVKRAAEKTTAPFQIVERGNRGIIYLGGRQKWLDAHPGDYRGADRYGKEINTTVNFNQGKSGRQSLLRDPTMHTVLQFKNYMLKAVEAFAKMNGREKATFIAATLVIGGPTSVPFVKYLTDRDEDGAAIVDALNKYTNVPRMFGMSFEHDAGVGFLPSSPIELLGPGGQLAYGLGERGMRAGVGDWPRKYQVDLGRNLRPTMLARAGQFLDSAEGDWRTFDREGRPVTQSTPGGALSNFLLGSRSKEWADRTTTQRRMTALIGRASEEKRSLAIQMVKASRAGADTSGIQAEIDRFNAENFDVVPPISGTYLDRLNNEFEVTKMERLGGRRRALAERVAP